MILNNAHKTLRPVKFLKLNRSVNVSFDDILKKENLANSLTEEVMVFERKIHTSKQISSPEIMPSVRLDDFAFVLCKYGELVVDVNYKSVCLSKGSLLALNLMHVFDNVRIEHYCEVLVVIISRNLLLSFRNDIHFTKKMTETLDERIRATPVLQLDENEMRRLTDIITRIQNNQERTDHIFQSQIIKNETSNFIMEYADIFLKRLSAENIKEKKESRKDEIIRKFVELIVQNYKEQREVAFYAGKLNMSPGNLARSVTSASGKSPLHWINHILLSEAKTLLRKPDSTVKQVSEELNFSDQASFAKFFKKYTGMTAMEYKNGLSFE